MRALKYSMFDIVRRKMLILCVPLCIVLSIFNCAITGVPMEGILPVMIIFAIVMQAITFSIEQKNEAGYINLFPGTTKDRVVGRFITGYFYMVIVMISEMIVIAISVMCDYRFSESMWKEFSIFVSTGLIFIAIQNLVYYLIGCEEVNRWKFLMRVLPCWIYYSVLVTIGFCIEIDDWGYSPKLVWFRNHLTVTCVALSVICILINVICIIISIKIVENDDFA